MKKSQVVTTEDILLMLCQSVSKVLTTATASQIHYSAMVQKINKTALKPDFGCFVLFDGGFTGLVVINFNAKAALEIYSNYMRNMGMPEEELAVLHTSDEVGDVLGELMNQLVGDFTNKVRKELQTNITQNQPKMLSLNKQVLLSVDTNLDRPQARRVTFSTEKTTFSILSLQWTKPNSFSWKSLTFLKMKIQTIFWNQHGNNRLTSHPRKCPIIVRKIKMNNRITPTLPIYSINSAYKRAPHSQAILSG